MRDGATVIGRRSLSLAAVLGIAPFWIGCSLIYSADDISGDRPNGGAFGEGGPSLCDKSEFVFCDGFEHGLDAAWRIDPSGGGSVTADSSKAFRGGQALHSALLASMAGATQSGVAIRDPPPWPETLFARFFAYLPAPFHHSATSIFNLNDAGAMGGMAVFVTGDTKFIATVTFDVQNGESMQSPTTMPFDRWTCFEVEIDGTTLNLWLDDGGTPVVTRAFPVSPANVLMSLGISYSTAAAGDPAYEAWFDEIAVASSRIGCTR